MRTPYTQLYVHCVWATWDRNPLITPGVEDQLYAAIKTKCAELNCEALAIGGDLDHVHLLAQLSSNVSVSHLVGEVKGASSHLMTHRIAPQREFKWQGSYGAFTVSRNGLKAVTSYIQNQKEHHANRRTFDGWEKCYLEESNSVQ